MLERLKHIFSRLWHLVIEAPETWDVIAREETDQQQLRQQYVYTLVALCALVGFVGTWLQSDIQHALAASMRDVIVLIGSYYAICRLCRLILERLYPNRFNLEDSDKIVTYSYAYIIIMQAFITIIPHSFYLYLLDLFVAYLLWEAARAVFALEEEERQSMVTYYTLLIVGLPIVLTIILNMLVLRNIL